MNLVWGKRKFNYRMGGSRYGSLNTKKKLLPMARRSRDRSRFSFFFVIFFFGLFSVIIIMENFIPHWNINSLIEDAEGEDDQYASSSDIDYEELPDAKFNSGTGVKKSVSKGNMFGEGTKKAGSVGTKSDVQFLGNSVGNSKGGVYHGGRNSSSTTKMYSQFVLQLDEKSDWQIVTGTKEKFHVYSAYYNENLNHVKVIGATRTRTQQRVKCRLYDNETRVFKTVDGSVRTIRENWNLKYSAVFIICHLGAKGSGDKKRMVVPRWVSILGSLSSPSSNLMRVQDAAEKGGNLVDFSVCVKPIHFNYDKLLPFLEWVEFHRLMGVKHFTFYNRTVGPKVACLLEQYGKDMIEMLPWSLPFVSQKEIRTEGLFVALNDCVYRHRGRSKYLILLDFDEMIVPRKTLNYTQFIDQLDTLSYKKKIGAYSVQNAFFYLQWPDDETTFPIPGNPLAEQVSKHLLSLRKTRRRARLHPHKQRSKYICDPEKVVEAGNHFVWEHTAGYNTLSVPPHLAALHHYRVCEFGGDQCIKNPSVVDKSAHVFGKELAIRVGEMLEKISQTCHIDVSQLFHAKPSSQGVL